MKKRNAESDVVCYVLLLDNHEIWRERDRERYVAYHQEGRCQDQDRSQRRGRRRGPAYPVAWTSTAEASTTNLYLPPPPPPHYHLPLCFFSSSSSEITFNFRGSRVFLKKFLFIYYK